MSYQSLILIFVFACSKRDKFVPNVQVEKENAVVAKDKSEEIENAHQKNKMSFVEKVSRVLTFDQTQERNIAVEAKEPIMPEIKKIIFPSGNSAGPKTINGSPIKDANGFEAQSLHQFKQGLKAKPPIIPKQNIEIPFSVESRPPVMPKL